MEENLSPETPSRSYAPPEPEQRRITPKDIADFAEKAGIRGFSSLEADFKNTYETLKADGARPTGYGMQMLGLFDSGFFRLLKELDYEIAQSRKWHNGSAVFGTFLSIIAVLGLGKSLLLAEQVVAAQPGYAITWTGALFGLALIAASQAAAWLFLKYAQKRAAAVERLLGRRAEIELCYSAMLLALASGNEHTIHSLSLDFSARARKHKEPQ